MEGLFGISSLDLWILTYLDSWFAINSSNTVGFPPLCPFANRAAKQPTGIICCLVQKVEAFAAEKGPRMKSCCHDEIFVRCQAGASWVGSPMASVNSMLDDGDLLDVCDGLFFFFGSFWFHNNV